MAALLFLAHGVQKFTGFPVPFPVDPLPTLLLVQGIIEVAGGVLLLIGLQTRLVAFILSGDMAAAYFMSHFPKSFFPVANSGDAAVLYCFIFFYFVFAGGGPIGIDRGGLRD
jgi:putative oxidoreductase